MLLGIFHANGNSRFQLGLSGTCSKSLTIEVFFLMGTHARKCRALHCFVDFGNEFIILHALMIITGRTDNKWPKRSENS